MGVLFCSVLGIEFKIKGKNRVLVIIGALHYMPIWDAVPIISLTKSELHHPQFISKSYGSICFYAHMQATEAQLTLCKGITFSDYLLHAHANYNFGRTYRHKFRRLVPLGGCACILMDEFTKIFTGSHKMSFIHVHILQRPKAIYVWLAIRPLKNLSKLKKCISAVCKHKRDFN